MNKDNKRTEGDNMDKKSHISNVITRCIHNFVNELVINENIDKGRLKCKYNERYGKITITETRPNMVRWFDKYIHNEL
jgi:hypothetical protein